MAKSSLHRPDMVIIGIAFFLVAFGLVMLASAGSVVGFERFGDANFYFIRQFFSFVIGLVAFFLFLRIPYQTWRKFALPMLGITFFLLLLVLLPGIGFEAGGARRWILIGGFTLQPSEILKLTFILYLGVWLEKRGKGLHDLAYGFLPFAVLLSTAAVLVLAEPDLGTVSIIFLISLVLYFAAGAPLKHIAGFLGIAAAAVFFLVKLAPYRAARLTVFLNPELDPEGIGYHINQALLAIGSGGLFGLGLGHSRQKYNFLPEVTGDSIFAVIAEELGFLIIVGLIALFLTLLFRGLRVARTAPDAFGRYLATGIVSGITLQALVHMGALSGVLPLTGITLPFVSFGGTSLIVTMASIGLLANISRQTKG